MYLPPNHRCSRRAAGENAGIRKQSWAPTVANAGSPVVALITSWSAVMKHDADRAPRSRQSQIRRRIVRVNLPLRPAVSRTKS
jgi:hypothetical protein